MSNETIFERNKLTSVAFSADLFDATIGDRLSTAGLHSIATEIALAGMSRHFLEKPLTSKEIQTINNTEGLAVAEKAEEFQKRVRQIEVRENGEPLTNLREIAVKNNIPWTFTTTPYHPACGEWAGKNRLFWIRQSMSDELLNVTEGLQSAEFGLHFEDGFRPLGVQEGLFKRRYLMAQSENPNWTHEQLVLEARSKTAYTPRFASHKGGAAVDVRIRNLHNNELLDIGHDYPDGGALVALESPLVTQRQWQNRSLLASLAMRNGMAMYPFEDWHVCMGDTTAAACFPGDELPQAIYSPIKVFNFETGDIVEVYSQTELDEIFDIA